MNLVETFKNLPPHQKRWAYGGGILFAVFASSFILSTSSGHANRGVRADKPEVTVIQPARMSGFEEFSTQIGQMQKQMDGMRRELDETRKSYDELLKRKPAESSAVSAPDSMPRSDLTFLEGSLSGPEPVEPAPLAQPVAPLPSTINIPPPLPSVSPPPVITPPSVSAATEPPSAPRRAKQIRLIGTLPDPAALPASASEQDDPQVFIPAGSMFTGVLLNGLDASTSSAGQKNPTPVIFRIKREAVLPNYASVDVRECFLLAAGFGQLASERAILRAETLSCVKADGRVFEAKIDAYVVGSDGKVGVPGRLVSKQGQMIAQSLLAGTLGGIGGALGKSRAPSLNLTPQNPIYEEESMSSIFQTGVASGFSNATNMIAKFYLDLAKETFPVVEIQAGEVGSIVVTRGTSLPLKGSTNLQPYSTQATASKAAPVHATPPNPSTPVSKTTETKPLAQANDAAPEEVRAVMQALNQQPRPNNFSTGAGWQ